MSIQDVRMRIDELRNEMTSRIQQASGGSRGFNTILQEKMDTTASAGQSVSSTLTGTALSSQKSTASSFVTKSGDIFVEGTLVGEEMMPLTEVQAFNYTQSASQGYGGYGTAGLSGYGAYGSYDPNCPQCAAQAAAGGYGATGAYGTNVTYGNMTATSSGLSSRDLEKAAPYMQYVNEASQRYGMPVNLILGIMKAESDFDNSCVSYAGAKGLMQLMPETAAEVGVTDEFDPRQNILGSVEYVTKLINKYGGDVRLALAAYNTGPGKIARRGVISSTSAEYLTVPQSIRDYAERVLKYAGYVG